MQRIAIIGNAGSGKSTLARHLAGQGDASVLDLDTLVWAPHQIALMRDTKAVLADVNRFCKSRATWVIEGCYADHIEAVLQFEPALIFLDPGRDACRANCRRRPWEPHKFSTKAEQDANLAFLLDWVDDYYVRDDLMSLKAHVELYERYTGPKRRVLELPCLEVTASGLTRAVQ